MQETILTAPCFHLKYTLDCGQCFRWNEVEPNCFIGVISDRVVKIKQEGDQLTISSNKEEQLAEVIADYFELTEPYQEIENKIITFDDHVRVAVTHTSGIHHLKQDFFEVLLSFIISANNNIPRISRSIQEISKRYGTCVMFEGEPYYLFPTPEQLQDVTIKEYRECGVGFRDSYLQSTVQDILANRFPITEIDSLSTEDLRKELMKLKGVGQKVADCILLFACGRKEVFPVDVWVERVMSVLYFKEAKGAMKKQEIIAYANQHFGKYAGIVQQHLFYNVREGNI